MKSVICSLLLIALALSNGIAQEHKTPIETEVETYKIAFGSCSKQSKEQKLWSSINDQNPILWIWLGDNIYADGYDSQELTDAYNQQKANVEYQKLRKSASIIGTWDDHDYGVNDGDKNYKNKKISRDRALEFLDVPNENPVWSREGLYQSYEYQVGEQLVRVILLDTRYFKDPSTKTLFGYTTDEDADILGSQQWQWLEDELSKKEDILIIANGTQIIPEDHKYEKWANYPKSRTRLLSLLDQESTEHIILLSGDRHIGEISKLQLSSKTIYEVTSSGLTHSYGKVGNEKNTHRVSRLVSQLNYGTMEIQDGGDIVLKLLGENNTVFDIVKVVQY